MVLTKESLPLGKGGRNSYSGRMRGGRGYRCTTSQSLPLEGGAPRSESKIYMTAGGSHTATTLSQRQLRLMRLKRSTITISWFKIATFDLIRHGLRPVTPSPPGEGFFRPAGELSSQKTSRRFPAGMCFLIIAASYCPKACLLYCRV